MKIFIYFIFTVALYSEDINGHLRDVSVMAENSIDTQIEVVTSHIPTTKKIVLTFKHIHSTITYMNFSNYKLAREYIKTYNFNTDNQIEYYRLVLTKNKGTYKELFMKEYVNPLYKK